MASHNATVNRTMPIEGTHLTELELQEMWYQHNEKIAAEGGPVSHHRAHSRLFPRSRRDLIDYYTQQDLAAHS